MKIEGHFAAHGAMQGDHRSPLFTGGWLSLARIIGLKGRCMGRYPKPFASIYMEEIYPVYRPNLPSGKLVISKHDFSRTCVIGAIRAIQPTTPCKRKHLQYRPQ